MHCDGFYFLRLNDLKELLKDHNFDHKTSLIEYLSNVFLGFSSGYISIFLLSIAFAAGKVLTRSAQGILKGK